MPGPRGAGILPAANSERLLARPDGPPFRGHPGRLKPNRNFTMKPTRHSSFLRSGQAPFRRRVPQKNKLLALGGMAGVLLLCGERAPAEVAVYYPFDADFTDQSGTGYHLTPTAPNPIITSANAGMSGEAVSFPGTADNTTNNSILERANGSIPLLNANYTNFTLSLWIQPDSWQEDINRTITGKSTTGSNRGWFLEKRGTDGNEDNNQLKFQFWNIPGGAGQNSQEFHFTPDALLPADAFTHVAITFAGTGAGGGNGLAKLYLNGIEMAEGYNPGYGDLFFPGDAPLATIAGANNVQLKIGNRGGSTTGREIAYKGLLDDYGLRAANDTASTATAREIALVHGLGRLAGVSLGSGTQINDVLNAYLNEGSAMAGGCLWEYVDSGLGGDTPVIGATGGSGSVADPYFIVLDTDGSGVAAVSEIVAAHSLKWKGNVNGTWDIDPAGNGATGTPNWINLSGNTPTRYFQTSGESDSVLFDDSADRGDVSLSAPLAPAALNVNNSSLGYIFTGPGKLTGLTALTKSGDGTLTLANAVLNDFTGGTVVEEGTLLLGDGITAGAGRISGNVFFGGDLVLNRPDDHDFTGLTLDPGSFGTLRKAQGNTVSFPATVGFPFDVALDDGTLRFTNGGTLSGTLSGSGNLAVEGGTLALAWGGDNTYSGIVSVGGGTLRLDKGPGIRAIGGEITLTGNSWIDMLHEEQIDDTTTLYLLASNTTPLRSGTGAKETVGNVHLNVNSVAEIILPDQFAVTGTVTVEHGRYSIGSSRTSSANAVVLTSPTAILRVSGNTGPTTMDVGPGGITASAGEIQVKYNTNNQHAVLNLGGDLTATGDLAITNGNYNGASLNVINLTGDRVFDIGPGATTTVSPDLGGDGSLTKAGQGALVLGSLCVAEHEGGTVVDAGALLVNGTHFGEIQVNAGGTLGGTGLITSEVDVAEGGTISPGQSVGMLRIHSTATLGGGSIYHWEAGDWEEPWGADLLNVDFLAITATEANPVVIRIAGTPGNFSESEKTFEIAYAFAGISGFNVDAFEIDHTAFAGTGTWEIRQSGNSLELVYTAGEGTPFSNWAADNGIPADPALDSDSDGIPNGIEFVLGTNPAPGSGSNSNDKLPVALKPGDAGYEPGYLTFVFRRSVLSASYNPFAEYSGDLTPESWTPAVHGEGGVIVSTAPGGDAGVDLVTVKIPRASEARLFVRLRVEIGG